MWVLDPVIGFERVVLTLRFGIASHLKCNAGDVLGRAAAVPVDDQRRKRGDTGGGDAHEVWILISTRGMVGR